MYKKKEKEDDALGILGACLEGIGLFVFGVCIEGGVVFTRRDSYVQFISQASLKMIVRKLGQGLKGWT